MKKNNSHISFLKLIIKGGILGFISVFILAISLEILSFGKFIKFPAMIIGIYACGLDGYGGFFKDCGNSHTAVYFVSFALLLLTGLLAGILISFLYWSLFFKRNFTIKTKPLFQYVQIPLISTI